MRCKLGAVQRVIVLLLLLTTSRGFCQSNEGTEFWLGFMEHRDANNSKVIMITSRVNTSGTISVPSQGWSRDFTVNANDVTVFNELPRIVETRGSEFINDNAIQIVSNDPTSVYIHQYFGMRSEASVVIPRSAIGNEYYVIAYSGVPNDLFGGQNDFYPSEFLIVANEDETEIEYTLSTNTRQGKIEGTTHSVFLNKGEVYQVQSQEWSDDLTGTHIIGNKDFSLFAGTTWSQVPVGCTFMDNLIEQMYPVSTWGRRYIGSPFANTSSDLFRVIASEDGTIVNVEGNGDMEFFINSGEYFDFDANNGAYIEANKPISVAQYIKGENCNGGIGDPSMVILNTVEQIRDTVTLFNSRFENITSNFINVISKSGEEDLIFFDGEKLVDRGINFSVIGSNGLFSYASVPTNAGAHTIYTQGCGIIAMAYGYGNVESYAYSGGASFNDINGNPIPEGSCLDEVILFDTGLPPQRFDVMWDLGDGNFSSEHKFEYKYPSSDTGNYNLSLIIEDLCFFEIDTLYKNLKVTLRQDLTVGDDQVGCEGTEIRIEANDLSGSSFEWTGPNGFVSEDQFPVFMEVELDQAGRYSVNGNISGCKTFPKDVEIEILENPNPDLGDDLVICPLDGDESDLDAGVYTNYLWQDGSTGSTTTVRDSGLYFVEVTDDNSCKGRDSILVIEQCPTRFYLPTVFTPNGDGVHDAFGLNGVEILEMDLRVFDRWGNQVYWTNSTQESWDGNHNGKKCINGEYAWILQLVGYREDATSFSENVNGTVLLIR